jgi:aarF domain-containing kinase
MMSSTLTEVPPRSGTNNRPVTIDATVTPAGIPPPSNRELLRKTLTKTREVLQDPDIDRYMTKLPKVNNERLDFETPEYDAAREAARARVLRDFNQAKGSGVDFLPLSYDVEQIRGYWDARPAQQASRASEIFFTALPIINNILLQKATGKPWGEIWASNAVQLREAIARLGPTFIKVAQALSVRSDILDPALQAELLKLLDDVPTFSNEEAKQMFKDELGTDFDTVFSEISADPLSAASIGQVYKAKLRTTGETVALKVQRPGIIEQISLDVCVMRKIFDQIKDFEFVKSDLIGLLDTWATRFYEELNFVQEGENGLRFRRSMLALSEVTAPKPIFEYTSRRILTLEWIDGTKLTDAPPEEVLRLVRIGVNCYFM